MTATDFVFDRNYDNREQVAHLYEAYDKRYQELVGAGSVPYNSDFKGKIDGLVADDKNEDTAIYLLQVTRHIREFDAEVQALRDEGYVEPEVEPQGITEVRYGNVAIIRRNFHGGRSGTVMVLGSARVVTRDGEVDKVLPKGARTRGHSVSARRSSVLVRA